AEKKFATETVPSALPRADRCVDPTTPEVDEFVGQRNAYGQVRIAHLKTSDPRTQPRAAEGYRRVEIQDVFVLLLQRRERFRDPREAAGDRWKDPLADIGKPHPPLLPHEQRLSDAIFELADLIADSGLGQSEFVRRT